MTEIATCASLAEVREHIDRIDSDIIGRMSERAAYVAQAARLKQSPAEIPAPERVRQVIARVREKAAACGLDADIADATYAAMIAAFIAWEAKRHAEA